MGLLRYTLLRLALVAACAAGLHLLGVRGALLWVMAILLAALLSFILLRGSAEAAERDLARWSARRRGGRSASDEPDPKR